MVTVKSTPILIFTLEAWKKLQGFLQLSPLEISGFGRVLPLGDDFLVDEIFLLPQKVSSGNTKINMIDVALFISNLMEAGEDPTNLRLWWHSHVRMGLNWSPTDDDNMSELAQTFMFGLVGSLTGEVKVRLDIADPALVIDDIPVKVDYLTEETVRFCLAEIREKVVVEEISRPPKRRKKGSRRGFGGIPLPAENEPFEEEDDQNPPMYENIVVVGGYHDDQDPDDGSYPNCTSTIS